MKEEKEAFLDRWSRLKREQPEEKPAVPEAKQEPAAPLVPVADLKADSDFTPFMDPRVDPGTRRLALKKLFSDAHYNAPDLFEPYSKDFTQSEPIPAKMLEAINRVRDVAVKGEEKVVEEERLAEQAERTKQIEKADVLDAPTQELRDVPGRQDA
jgi:hypothetical protein